MLISLKSIGHSYAHPLFHDLSLEISDGDFVSIYGPSGVGKTTLLQIIGKLLSPKEWSMKFHTILNNRKKSFWYAFVGWPFFEEMSVKDNILFLDVFSEVRPDIQKYQEIMDYFEMKKFEHTPVKSLSVGQRERVNIMRAFVHHPKVVVLDEPGSNLDDRLFDKLFAFLEGENTKHKTTIIVATHHTRYRDISTQTLHLDLIENV